jgi:hypothetical protein
MHNDIPPILQILSEGKKIVIGSPKADDDVLLNPEELELAQSLAQIAKKYGKFNEDGTGVWAGYKSASENFKRHKGIKCANCVLWEGGSSCKIIDFKVEPEGKCRFIVIPNGVVQKSIPDVPIATLKCLDFLNARDVGISIKSMKYTKPKLRESIKNRIMAGSKGGRPGQWSARKAQLLATEYRKAGGGYRGAPGKSQRSLKKWTREDWTTSDGKPALRKGRMTRYLPAAAWKRLTPAQRRATIAKKLAGDKSGKQFVANTARAKKASKKERQ